MITNDGFFNPIAKNILLSDVDDNFLSYNIEDAMKEVSYKGNYNYIINGNFDVWQRGTSFTSPSVSTYTSDRTLISYALDGGTLPTLVHSRQEVTPGAIDGAKYFYRINANGTGSGFGNGAYYITILQQIENGLRLLGGKTVTVSFYIRSDIAGRIVALEPFMVYGTGGSPSAGEALQYKRITCTTGWTKVTHTFTLNSLTGKTFGTNNDDRLYLQLWLHTNSSFSSRVGGTIPFSAGNIDITQLTCYVGNISPMFIPPTFEEELRKCQRYYENSYTQGHYPATETYIGIFSTQGTGNNNSNRINYSISFLIPKRIIPVVHTYDADGHYDKIGTYDNAGAVTNNVTASTAPYQISTKLFRGQHVVSGSGLIFHWTADAEF